MGPHLYRSRRRVAASGAFNLRSCCGSRNSGASRPADPAKSGAVGAHARRTDAMSSGRQLSDSLGRGGCPRQVDAVPLLRSSLALRAPAAVAQRQAADDARVPTNAAGTVGGRPESLGGRPEPLCGSRTRPEVALESASGVRGDAQLGMGPYGIPAHRSSLPAVWCLACGFLSSKIPLLEDLKRSYYEHPHAAPPEPGRGCTVLP